MTYKLKTLQFILLLSCLLSSQQPASDSSYDLIIENSTIVDTQNAVLIPDQSIFIRQGLIDKITPGKIDDRIRADTIIDGTDKYIVPGFWDMHVHTCWKNGSDKTTLPLFLQYGITGVRDMGGRLDVLNTFKERAQNQPQAYPHLFGSGPIIDGQYPVHPDFSIPMTTENFKPILDSLRNQHVDFFKVYSLLPRSVLDSIANYSRQHNIHFSGHISEYIKPIDAVELGYKSFEHLNKLEPLMDDSLALKQFILKAKENENWLCPTLMIYQRRFEMDQGQFFNHSLHRELDSDLKLEWDNVRKSYSAKSAEAIQQSEDKFARQKELVKIFYDSGIPLLIGTDFAGMPFIYPGYSFHEAMQLMQEIGIPPFEILKIATWNPAKFFGITDSYGTVEPGKVADLIMLDASPIENIENTLEINVVIKSGIIVQF